MARQIGRSFDIAEMAVKQAGNGDWDLAGNTILEIPQDAAESAARILVSPIYAVMAVPAAVRTVMDPQADPEKRGEAAVDALHGIATVVATVAGGKTAPGDILTIRGRETPCPMCRPAMREAASQRQIKIEYTDGQGKKHTF